MNVGTEMFFRSLQKAETIMCPKFLTYMRATVIFTKVLRQHNKTVPWTGNFFVDS